MANRETGEVSAGAVLVGLILLLAACAPQPAGDADLSVVATTTILGDVVANIVGSDGVVEVLVPNGVDPHDYRASARQIASLQQADLVVANGLGLEEALLDVLSAARADGVNVLEVAPRLDPLPFGEGAGSDPHVWWDPARMAEAAGLIAAELAALSPGTDWAVRADAYAARLLDADEQISRALDGVPEGNRKLVTNHDSLGYFADRYGFEVAGTVFPGGSTLADPSSEELAGLVAIIEREAVPAIFVETISGSGLADAVAAEVGRDVEVVELYTDSLGPPGSGADTLIGMLLTNVDRIAAALGGSSSVPD